MSETRIRPGAGNTETAGNLAGSENNSSSIVPFVASAAQDDHGPGMRRTETQIYTETTDAYLDQIDVMNLPSPKEIERQLMKRTQAEFIIENRLREPEKGDRGVTKGILLTLPQRLANMQVAMVVKRLHHVRAVLLFGSNRDDALLAIYEVDGPNQGLYVTSERDLHTVVAQYNPSIGTIALKEVQQILHRDAPVANVSNGGSVAHLSVLANGIWNHHLQTLEPFSPDYIFLARASVIEYDENAQNVYITMPDGKVWDVETWVEELHDDPEIQVLLWEMLGAVVRPNVSWHKSAWFYATRGNNGKGTFARLMANLVGEASTATLSIKDFGKDFMKEQLPRSSAIINDENDVGTYIDEGADLKAVITNDRILINRKHKAAIPFRFWGFMVQCLNEFPKVRDKSESFLRRPLIVPFDKSFKGIERKYIKEDYLQRDDVLRYVLKRVLQMQYTELSEPARCVAELDKFREENNGRVQFIREFEDQFAWDLVPFSFLFALLKEWKFRVDPDAKVGSQNKLTSFLKDYFADSDEWEIVRCMRPGQMMSTPEYLINEYNLKTWMNSSYSGTDPTKRCTGIALAANYAGLMRRQPRTAAAVSNNDDED